LGVKSIGDGVMGVGVVSGEEEEEDSNVLSGGVLG